MKNNNNINNLIKLLNNSKKNNKIKLQSIYNDYITNLSDNAMRTYSQSKLFNYSTFISIYKILKTRDLKLNDFNEFKKKENFNSTNATPSGSQSKEEKQEEIDAYCDIAKNSVKDSCICSNNLKKISNTRKLREDNYNSEFQAYQVRYNNLISNYNTAKAHKQNEYNTYNEIFEEPSSFDDWFGPESGAKAQCIWGDKAVCRDPLVGHTVNHYWPGTENSSSSNGLYSDLIISMWKKHDAECDDSGWGPWGCRYRKRYTQSKIDRLMAQWNLDNPEPTHEQANPPTPLTAYAPKIQCCINSINTVHTTLDGVTQSCNQSIIEMKNDEEENIDEITTPVQSADSDLPKPPNDSDPPKPPNDSKKILWAIIIISSIMGLSLISGIFIYFLKSPKKVSKFGRRKY